MTCVTLTNLHKTYPRQPAPAVDAVSLSVSPGELMALLGPSGSGKSTLLKLIAGIEHPDAGDIRFDGRSILPVPANRRGAVLMFQKAYLFPFLSVADNIAFGLKVQRAPRATIRAEVARMLELVELPGFERRYPSQLSGGEQQRVALARALVTRPRVLLLDEPLSSLDPTVRLTLQTAIRRIQREMGITMLLVTHDLSEAITMADRLALLINGRLVACDRPEGLFQRPPNRTAARFVGVTTFLEGEVADGRLCTGLGSLAVPPAPGPPRPATFAIRPERLRLRTDPACNTLPGIVAGRVYKGEFVEYQVRVGAALLPVRVYQAECDHSPGAAVYVQFPPDQLFEVGD